MFYVFLFQNYAGHNFTRIIKADSKIEAIKSFKQIYNEEILGITEYTREEIMELISGGIKMTVLANIKKIQKDKYIRSDFDYREYDNYIYIDTLKIDYSMVLHIDKNNSILSIDRTPEECDILSEDLINLLIYMFDNNYLNIIKEE